MIKKRIRDKPSTRESNAFPPPNQHNLLPKAVPHFSSQNSARRHVRATDFPTWADSVGERVLRRTRVRCRRRHRPPYAYKLGYFFSCTRYLKTLKRRGTWQKTLLRFFQMTLQNQCNSSSLKFPRVEPRITRGHVLEYLRLLIDASESDKCTALSILLLSTTSASGNLPLSFTMNPARRNRSNPLNQSSGDDDSGIQNEQTILLVLQAAKWDIQILCLTASVNRRLQAIAKRVLWRELCINRAPRMSASLTSGAPNGRVGGGWNALAKLMFYCCGCQANRYFRVTHSVPGHFIESSRFSKTSGRSFLAKSCREDLLYVTDPCEHPVADVDDYVGIFRGVFRGFMRSKTRGLLIVRQVQFEETVRCPYCGARVWSMTEAQLIPKSAARRLGSRDGGLEYFVCVNGHLHGSCWLVALSSDGEENSNDEEDGEEENLSRSSKLDNVVRQIGLEDRTFTGGSSSSRSTGEEIRANQVADGRLHRGPLSSVNRWISDQDSKMTWMPIA